MDGQWDVLGVGEGAEEVARALENSLLGPAGRHWLEKIGSKLPVLLMRLSWVTVMTIGTAKALCSFVDQTTHSVMQAVFNLLFQLVVLLVVGELLQSVVKWKFDMNKHIQREATENTLEGTTRGSLAAVSLESFLEAPPPSICLRLHQEAGCSTRFMSVEADPIRCQFLGMLSYCGRRVGLRVQEEGEIHNSCMLQAESSSPGTLRLRSVLTDTHITALGGWGYSKTLAAWESKPMRTCDGSDQGGADEEFSFERADTGAEHTSEFEVVVVRHLKSSAYLSQLGKNQLGGFGLSNRNKATKFQLCSASVKQE